MAGKTYEQDKSQEPNRGQPGAPGGPIKDREDKKPRRQEDGAIGDKPSA
jgi:hypothetical protein